MKANRVCHLIKKRLALTSERDGTLSESGPFLFGGVMPKNVIKRDTVIRALSKGTSARSTRTSAPFVPTVEINPYVYDKKRVHEAFAQQLAK